MWHLGQVSRSSGRNGNSMDEFSGVAVGAFVIKDKWRTTLETAVAVSGLMKSAVWTDNFIRWT